MNLILWRHAEAEDIGPDGTDASRRLTARGHKQAAQMAIWLNEQLPEDTQILVSPATRTQQTADALQRSYNIDPRLFTDASVKDYLAASQWQEGKGTLLFVGHQPTLGQLAALLVCGTAQAWSVKKGAIWWLSSAAHSESATIRYVSDTNFL